MSDAPLERYRAKRDFERSPEPGPERRASASGRSFVIQKHDASRLHYDLRLEHDGVLWSWAVPKGPSLDPADKRLAMRTEDHPVEYGGFEGVIPKDEYGGGTVLLWDRGEWICEGDPAEGLAKGRLRFVLEGHKLRGRWNLVRSRKKQARDGEAWLLIKGKDGEARTVGASVVDARPESVASGRDLAQIAADPDRVWHSHRAEEGAGPEAMPEPGAVEGAKRQRRLPKAAKPALCAPVDAPATSDRWVHEVKHDGYRILARLADGVAILQTRNGHDWTAKMPSLARSLAALPVDAAWIDGEIVVLDAEGRSRFGALQSALEPGRDHAIRYLAFDLLHLDGWDLRPASLVDRKSTLRAVLQAGGALEGRVRFGAHVRGQGAAFLAEACRMGVEGVVSKRADAPYRAGRSKAWTKTKCLARDDFVVGGWTEPSGARAGFGALLIGERVDGALRFRGKVGAGFDGSTLRALHPRLEALASDESPFDDLARRPKGAHWVRPVLSVEVKYTERTDDGRLRHPVFLGVREDRAPEPEAAPPGEASGDPVRIAAGVRVTTPERVYWPNAGITKRELALHWLRVAELALPHLRDRPLSLVRCPDGIDADCFYFKHAVRGLPEALAPVDVGDDAPHTHLRDAAGLVALAQIGALETHVWGARRGSLERPDQLVFDLDPGSGVDWPGVVAAAREVRALLTQLELVSFVKLTGGKGVHVVVPVRPRIAWDEAKRFCLAVAQTLERRDPDRYTAELSKAKRGGKVFVDYLRNGRGATAVAPWSPRARPGAPIAAPVAWDRLDELRPDAIGLRDVAAHLEARDADPWAGFFEVDQAVPPL
ncbi:MAG TPA: DNA ligase D [Sandaracinaceae bacterium LLY-WYZ-13_1]|nr:DNA ligase D [Sandaracinaceae bacterium LLY-WYZ-13_1]